MFQYLMGIKSFFLDFKKWYKNGQKQQKIHYWHDEQKKQMLNTPLISFYLAKIGEFLPSFQVEPSRGNDGDKANVSKHRK